MKRTAILVDGGFFLKRFKHIYKIKNLEPKKTADQLHTLCLKHLTQKEGKEVKYDLHRILYYDCVPYQKKQHNPVTDKAIDFAKTEQYEFRTSFFSHLKEKRKAALRLGTLDRGKWTLYDDKLRNLLKGKIKHLKGKIKHSDIAENDVYFDIRQKQVDMKMGLDIATMALKKQVDQIILISGDSDFVPAAKLARREGIDFVLDPMWNRIKPDLFEHIDGLRTTIQKPKDIKK